MSELIKLDALKSDAEAAADKLHAPERYLEKYEPGLHSIWRTHYFARVTENEKAAALGEQGREAA